MMPQISIIIPFNNGKKYLKNCLNNITAINYNDYEIILIDDFSNDNSEKIARKYKKTKYYYSAEKSRGVGNARNLGIKKANGKYIMFLDVDDTIDKELLKNLKNYMNKDVEMIKYKMKIIEKKEIYADGPIFDVTDGEEGLNKLCFKDKYLDSPCLYLIKKELFERTGLNFEKDVYHEDFGLIPLLIANAKSIVSTKIYGYNYFQSENSIMRNNDYLKHIKKVEDKFFLYDKIYEKLEKMNLKKETKQNLLEYYTNSIISGIKDLKTNDRNSFKKEIMEKGMIDNLRVRNLKQKIRKELIKLRLKN